MQKILLLLLLFSLTLFGSNPKVYSSLGDVIYNNISKIQSLNKLEKYKVFKKKIEGYSNRVNKAKEFGFEVGSGNKSNLKLDYLKEIRKLSAINDYFIRMAISDFKSAIATQDNNLFIGIVNSGLIDVKKYKNKIMNYYDKHNDKINSDGVIQAFIDEAYAKKHKKKYKPKTNKQLEIENIKRIRAKDRLKQVALEKKLSLEVKMKKQKIREEQEKELFN